MIFKIFLIECRRSFKVMLLLFLSTFLFGFSFSASVNLKNYLENLFSPTDWGADLIVLPKGISLESLHRSLLKGEPEGLIPIALFNTLQTQVNETNQISSAQPIKILGFIPYQEQQHAELAVAGDAETFFKESKNKSIWDHLKKNSWDQKNSDFSMRAEYQTPEWGSKVLMGILVKGTREPLIKMKELIDRRTVAQAYWLSSGLTEADHRLEQLKSGLFIFAGLIFLCLLPGLLLSLFVLQTRRQSIFLVLNEVGCKQDSRWKFLFLQTGFLILLPVLLGYIVAGVLPVNFFIF